ncbi:TatD family deoxyribonuclease [Candidatus Pacearchaeota archaeon]|nr:TatD family deoxyribonuclease [Candidatus Pacearchaeota archaeon]
MTYIDIHCHLDLLENISQVIENANNSGVEIILTQGINAETNRKALALAKEYKEVKACLGIYPIDALKMTDKEIDSEIAFIKANKKYIVAIGEVGMDFKEDDIDHERQKKIFTKFIALSIELDMPIIIHSRKAEKECIELLEKCNAMKVIMHCFCGKWKLVERIQKNGWFLTVPTSVTKSEQFQAIAQEVPLAQLFCETDSPYLHPDKIWPNEPANIVRSYLELARLRKISVEDGREIIRNNYLKLFKK